MSDTRRQVLQMVQDGKITADQALELLGALEPPETAEPETNAANEVIIGEVSQPESSPDMSSFRRYWQVPFMITLVFLLISGLILRAIYQSSNGAISLGFVCAWSVFIFAFLLALLAFMSRRSAWVHVRVKEKEGRRIAISLPLPLGLASWGVSVARGFAAEDDRLKLEMAAAFLAEARHNLQQPQSDPLMINVDDDDGDKVQVYIG